MTIYLIRHGQTTANVAKRFSGHWDVDLTDEGQEQALRAQKALKDVHFDAAYCSDLKRAKMTAEIILEGHDEVTLKTESQFREMNFGTWEGQTFKEIKKVYPNEFQKWLDDYERFKTPEGESVFEMYERVVEQFERILALYNKDEDTSRILIVAHGGVLQALLSYFCYRDTSGYWKFRIDNCGINIVEYVMGMPVIKGINKRILD